MNSKKYFVAVFNGVETAITPIPWNVFLPSSVHIVLSALSVTHWVTLLGYFVRTSSSLMRQWNSAWTLYIHCRKWSILDRKVRWSTIWIQIHGQAQHLIQAARVVSLTEILHLVLSIDQWQFLSRGILWWFVETFATLKSTTNMQHQHHGCHRLMVRSPDYMTFFELGL